MNQYIYKVKDQKGEARSGTIEAADEKHAVLTLQGHGFIVISLTAKANIFQPGNLLRKIQGVSLSDLVNFTRQLSTMSNAGLPLTDALRILRSQFKNNKRLSEVLEIVLHDVEGGSSLATALSKHPGVFSPIYISLVKAGESAAVLDNILMRLADNLEKEREFQGKTKGALIYPVIVVVGMLGVMFIMMVFVVPKLTSIYKDMSVDLPTPTKILIAVSGFLSNFWWLVIAGLAGAGFFVKRWSQTKTGRRTIEEIFFRMPIVGNLQKQVVLTEFSRTLSLLVSAGIPIIEALHIVREAVGNSIYEEGIDEAAKQVERGFPLNLSISQNPNFPPILGQMIKTGEETGKLDEVLMRLSNFFESESEQAIKGLTTAIEPVIMVVLGVGVGFLILSIIMPIYKLTSSF